MAARSVRDVAQHAGVSVGTVSNVLNHPEKVLPATVVRVQESIDQLGFRAAADPPAGDDVQQHGVSPGWRCRAST